MITMIALASAAAIFFMVVRVLKGGIYGMLCQDAGVVVFYRA